MAKSYIYYVTYAGSNDCCFEIHKGKVILPKPIETDDHIKQVEEMIGKKTGDELIRCGGGHRPALLGFSLLRIEDVESNTNAGFYDEEELVRACT